MSNFRETIQQFLKGIDSRIPSERVGPDRPIKLQNARLFKRGETGFITRIKGFVRMLRPFASDYQQSQDMMPVTGKTDTSAYLKGYRVSFVETLSIGDDVDGMDMIHPQVVDQIGFNEQFSSYSEKLIHIFVDKVTFNETMFRTRKVPVLKFVETITFSEVITRGNFVDLSFVDTFQVIDNPMQLQ